MCLYTYKPRHLCVFIHENYGFYVFLFKATTVFMCFYSKQPRFLCVVTHRNNGFYTQKSRFLCIFIHKNLGFYVLPYIKNNGFYVFLYIKPRLNINVFFVLYNGIKVESNDAKILPLCDSSYISVQFYLTKY